ncbi:MAG: hypothetical protein LQ345_000254 [Seirophora villosa]|nr:MAG: hypothetical protein LQ345_000254 [Seirophora villosa]
MSSQKDFRLPQPSARSSDSLGTDSSSSTRPSIHYDAPPAFRSVRPLPYELCEQCIIYFEEGLSKFLHPWQRIILNGTSDVPALNLLISLLTFGTSSTPPRPAFLPPAQQLALAATLAIHPSLTTRAQSENTLQVSILAIRYLRLVLHLVGPINGKLQDAFAFSTVETSSRRRARRRTTGDDVGILKDDLNALDTKLANTGSLWVNAQDFWHVVGWAFNCSLLHQKRWERWSLWLQYMVDVLDQDWALRAHMQEQDANSGEDAREGSIIIRYLSRDDTTARQERRIVRAIFAEGSPKSTAEFPEVWRNETKERKKVDDAPKAERKLNIDADNWGDYMKGASSSSDLEDSPPPESPSKTTPTGGSTDISDVTAPFGGPESLVLRLRLLSLLSMVCAALPHTFTSLPTLYDVFLEHIRPLPLPQFFLVVSPSSMQHFHSAAASCILQVILRSLLASSAPLPRCDDVTQETLERCYLPYPANTGSISDNAKVSLCVETLLRLLQKHIGLEWTESLQEKAEKGIEAREQKAKKTGKGKGRGKGADEEERMWLRGSAGRISGLLELVRIQQEAMEV